MDAGIVSDGQLVQLLDAGYVVVPVQCVSPQGIEHALRPAAPPTPGGAYRRGLLVPAACEAFGLTRAQMLGTSRTRIRARPRQYAMHFGSRRIGYSTTELGRMFGGRDHSTVTHAIRRVEALLAEPATSWEAAEALQRIEQAYARAEALAVRPATADVPPKLDGVRR